jgi:hypothetical protein
MADDFAHPDPDLTPAVRLREIIREQQIENNPLSEADIRMFEMFEREGWDGDRCRAYMLARLIAPAAE